jgi:hypothetical protein
VSLALSFSTPYFTGVSRTVEVPGRFHCALNGRPYMIDDSRMSEFRRQAIPLLRQQADNSEAFGEQTLSPEELWRSSQDDWGHGAGQVYLDREGSDNQRFRSSKGIDVWERWAMSLLPDTAQRRGSVNTNLALQPVGSNLYLLDGAALVRTTDLVTFTVVTGTPTAAPTSIASDGFNVFTAHGGSGVFSTTRGSATSSAYNTLACTLLGYVKGRLMAANGASLYNITSGTVPAALFTQTNSDFTWVGFAEGQNAIYAAGFSGDKSLVYRIALKADATALDAPIVAGELPDGEVVRSIGGYLGFVLLGTDRGVRFCATDNNGNLTIGALVRTNSAVRCFEGQDRFVWFGWTNYDATSTGLGRLDLSVFTAPLTPAYASDLMVTGQGRVTSVATFRGVRVLAVAGLGFFEQTPELVPSGTLDTGLITYGLPDLKTAVYLDVKVRSSIDANRAYVAVDGGAFVKVGERSSRISDPFSVGEVSGEAFEVRHELVNTGVGTVAPIITRYTLRSYPRPSQGELLLVPVLLHEQVETVQGDEYYYNPQDEFARIVRLRARKQLVSFQIGTEALTCQVDDALFQYSHLTGDKRGWNGTALLKLKSPAT